MRKVLFFLSIVLLTVGMSSYGKGYDLNKCESFADKIKRALEEPNTSADEVVSPFDIDSTNVAGATDIEDTMDFAVADNDNDNDPLDNVYFTSGDYAEMIKQLKGLCSFLDSKVDGMADLKSEDEMEEYMESFKKELEVFDVLSSFLGKKNGIDVGLDNMDDYIEFFEMKDEYNKHLAEVLVKLKLKEQED